MLELRFGLIGAQPRTLQEVGYILGLSRARVRQIDSHALHELEALAHAQPLRDPA